MDEIQLYGVIAIMVFMFYTLHKYPNVYQLQILYILAIPWYIISKWDYLEMEFNVICLLITVILNFFFLQRNLMKSNV